MAIKRRDNYRPSGSFTTDTSFVGFVNLADEFKDDETLTTYIQEFETPNFTKNYTQKKKANKEIFLKGVATTQTPVTINFVIDDDWFVYTQLLDIFNENIQIEDLDLFLLGSRDIAVVGITYHGASISNIGSVQVNTKSDGAVVVTVPVEFIFTKFTYERIQ